MNPSAIGLTSIHKAKSRTCFVDFDFDGVFFGERKADFDQVINPGAYSVIGTRGGFHILVDPSKVSSKFAKSWHQGLLTFEECDVCGDNLIPIVGCTQGGHTPSLIK